MSNTAKGLQGVVAAQTAKSLVMGEVGRLIYAGYNIRDLADHGTFESVVYLLWHGELPTQDQLAHLKTQLAQERALPEAVIATLKVLPSDALPMDALRTGVSALGAAYPPATQTTEAGAIAVLGRVATIIAAFHRIRQGVAPIDPRPDLTYAANYLYMLNGQVPSPAQARVLDVYMILLADHGLNASTFTARVVASTLSDMVSAVVAGIGALKGPLHGGAPSEVVKMLDEIGDAANAEAWLKNALAHGERIMGFGHRVYRAEDPRADVLRDLAATVSTPARYALARTTEEHALPLLEAHRPGRKLYTNVEFYSALVMEGAGLPADLFTPTFAASRTAGWTAHIMEQVSDNRIIRPDADYTGPAERPYPA